MLVVPFSRHDQCMSSHLDNVQEFTLGKLSGGISELRVCLDWTRSRGCHIFTAYRNTERLTH